MEFQMWILPNAIGWIEECHRPFEPLVRSNRKMARWWSLRRLRQYDLELQCTMLRMLRTWPALHSLDRLDDRLVWNRVWPKLQQVADDPIRLNGIFIVCAFSQANGGKVFYSQNHEYIDWAYDLVQLLPPLRCPSYIWVPHHPWNPETNSTADTFVSTSSFHSCEKQNKLILSPPARKQVNSTMENCQFEFTKYLARCLDSAPWAGIFQRFSVSMSFLRAPKTMWLVEIGDTNWQSRFLTTKFECLLSAR